MKTLQTKRMSFVYILICPLLCLAQGASSGGSDGKPPPNGAEGASLRSRGSQVHPAGGAKLLLRGDQEILAGERLTVKFVGLTEAEEEILRDDPYFIHVRYFQKIGDGSDARLKAIDISYNSSPRRPLTSGNTYSLPGEGLVRITIGPHPSPNTLGRRFGSRFGSVWMGKKEKGVDLEVHVGALRLQQESPPTGSTPPIQSNFRIFQDPEDSNNIKRRLVDVLTIESGSSGCSEFNNGVRLLDFYETNRPNLIEDLLVQMQTDFSGESARREYIQLQLPNTRSCLNFRNSELSTSVERTLPVELALKVRLLEASQIYPSYIASKGTILVLPGSYMIQQAWTNGDSKFYRFALPPHSESKY